LATHLQLFYSKFNGSNNQMIINIFGDFVTEDPLSNIELDDELEELLLKASFNVCNFEGPIESDGEPISKTGPNLFINKQAPKWLIKNNFKVVSLANNHILDYGDNGLIATKKAFSEIKTIGAGSWDEAYKPSIVNIEGKKIAFLAFTHCEFGTLTDEFDKEHLTGAAWINHDKVASAIIDVKQKADYIIALPHGGYEFWEQPLPEWRSRYKALIDFGCDAVIASHPHIIQGIELHKDKPIFYSLGNFFFPKNYSQKDFWYYSLCIELEFNEKINFKTIPIKFTEKSITLCDKKDPIFKYIARINQTLHNDKEYISYINQKCDETLEAYYPILFKKRKLRIIDRILKKKGLAINTINDSLQTMLHIINNNRCESHRWCIARAMKNRFQIQ